MEGEGGGGRGEGGGLRWRTWFRVEVPFRRAMSRRKLHKAISSPFAGGASSHHLTLPGPGRVHVSGFRA